MTHTIAVIPGDGIGPEIMRATLRVLDALNLGLQYDFVEAGLAAQEKHGELLPQATLDAIAKHKVAREVSAQYPDIEHNEMIVDNTCMQLVLNPWQFDVLVTTNLFGDIISDLCAGLVGGLGLAPGANIGADAAIFEAVHGSAPDIAGKGIANATALMLAAAMMLDHVKLQDKATRLRQAIADTLNVDKVRTGDLGGNASCVQFAKAVVGRISNG